MSVSSCAHRHIHMCMPGHTHTPTHPRTIALLLCVLFGNDSCLELLRGNRELPWVPSLLPGPVCNCMRLGPVGAQQSSGGKDRPLSLWEVVLSAGDNDSIFWSLWKTSTYKLISFCLLVSVSLHLHFHLLNLFFLLLPY